MDGWMLFLFFSRSVGCCLIVTAIPKRGPDFFLAPSKLETRIITVPKYKYRLYNIV